MDVTAIHGLRGLIRREFAQALIEEAEIFRYRHAVESDLGTETVLCHPIKRLHADRERVLEARHLEKNANGILFPAEVQIPVDTTVYRGFDIRNRHTISLPDM